jgi:hypothetical protein
MVCIHSDFSDDIAKTGLAITKNFVIAATIKIFEKLYIT